MHGFINVKSVKPATPKTPRPLTKQFWDSICIYRNIFESTRNQHAFIPLAAKQWEDWNSLHAWSWDGLLTDELVSVVSVRLESYVCLADCRRWYRACVACSIVGVAFQSKYIAAFHTSVRLGGKKKHGTEEK